MLRIETIKSILPSGVTIANNGDKGSSLIATKALNTGDILYTASWLEIEDPVETYSYTVKFYNDKDEYLQEMVYDVHRHAVKDGKNRQVYGFDGFMNHSCDANTYSQSVKDGTRLGYHTVASKRIEKGDEISCDYFHFDYECSGHSFRCLCGSSLCCGYVKGFKNLPLPEKVKRLGMVDNYIKEQFLSDYSDVHILEEVIEIPNNMKIYYNEERHFYFMFRKDFRIIYPEYDSYVEDSWIFRLKKNDDSDHAVYAIVI
jgi:hypothetical protein